MSASMNPHCECKAAGFCKRHKIMKSHRQFQLCKGIANTADCGFKYWRAWEQGQLNATSPDVPVLDRDWDCGNNPPPVSQPRRELLGDKVANALGRIGITEDRVSSWLGAPCGCAARKKKLNKLHLWAERIIKGDQDGAKHELVREIGQGPVVPTRRKRWSYGVTTVSSRVGTTLPTTLKSLEAAGFDCPWIFADGVSDPSPIMEAFSTDRVVARGKTPLKTFGNWILALWELYVRQPHADLYALFQDDIVMCRGVKEYLEWSAYPDDGYMNLYTDPRYNKAGQHQGWNITSQRGLGALALVFDRDSVPALLSSYEHIVNRPRSDKPTFAIDGGIVDAMKKLGRYEYIHKPGLVQHIGKKSTMKHNFVESGSFAGEDFDARSLLR